MRIPLGHGYGLMPQKLRYLVEVDTCLSKASCESMPQVMKPEVFDLCPVQGVIKTPPQIPLGASVRRRLSPQSPFY
ncbi:hypothetical protein BAC2_01433 [uncultured bacterium]|nr:hypothetical protein BAC2_01433 [uncultured bacterium]